MWVIEATLRQGQRHQAARSRYYCDEDSWNCVLGDRWDANGQLWRTLWTNVIVVPEQADVAGEPSIPWGLVALWPVLELVSILAGITVLEAAGGSRDNRGDALGAAGWRIGADRHSYSSR